MNDIPMRRRPRPTAFVPAALLLLAALGAIAAATPPAAKAPVAQPPASKRGPIAQIGDRRVEEIDIREAAIALAADPLSERDPAAWRRKLLDRCIDRELLAMEAGRRGLADDASVRRRIAEREYTTLLGEIHRRVLVPGIEPTEAQLDSIRAAGLLRGVEISTIVIPAPFGQDARRIADRLRAGARFDSTARMRSIHPSASAGGRFGWVLVRDLDARSHDAVRAAQPGQVLGPYSSQYGHQIYRIEAFADLPHDSLYNIVKDERTRGLLRHYQEDLLRRHRFALDSTQVDAVLFAAATESVDSILASLGPDGARPERGSRPALGVIARADSDSVTFRDLASPQLRTWPPGGKLRLRSVEELEARCGLALVPRLLPRDARARGLDRDPAVARALRMVRDEEATRAMVERGAGAAPDSAALRAHFAANAARYQRPRAVRALVACFDSAGPAEAALLAWNGKGMRDSALAALGMRPQPRATAQTLYPGRYAELTVLETDADPLALAVRTLSPGQLSPVVRTVQGHALAEARAREDARPLSFEEAAPRVAMDLREAREDGWTRTLVASLRAKTKIEVVPARLEAVRLTLPQARKGTR
jgi:hypothetical protein